MQKCVVLINPIDTGQVTDIEEVHARSRQRVNWIVIIQNRLLFSVPLRFGRAHANVIDPVGARFESDDLDSLIPQLKGQRFIVWHEVWRR